MEKMNAAVCEAYGPPEVLSFKEVEKPVPGEKDLLIKVHASSVNAADCNIRGMTYIPSGLGFLARLMLGVNKPKISIQGSALSGVVEAVGKDVQTFKAGDEVFGSGAKLGGYGEFACWPEKGSLALKPSKISHEEAAALPYGGLTALYFLRDKARVREGQKVLINGASGGVGVYAVQLARYFGAEVTGVCSTSNLEFVRSLGAHHVFDYTKEDFRASGQKWDVILDVVVGHTSFSKYKNSLQPQGYYLAVAGGIGDMLQMARTSLGGGRKVVFGGGSDGEKIENLLFLNGLINTGELKPVMTRSFPFEQIVDAHRYAESGKKRGNVAIKLP